MAMKWNGSQEKLDATLRELGASGDWSDVEKGRQFRCTDGAILNWYPSSGTLQFQGKPEPREALQRALEGTLGEAPPSSTGGGTSATPKDAAGAEERVFVVHGHDDTSREQLELVLHRLGLDPFVLANTGG